MKTFKRVQKQIHRGFTLIELMVVMAIIGILIAVLAPIVKDALSPSKATGYISAADQINKTWTLITRSCGLSAAVSGSKLPANGKTVSDVLFGGVANVATQFQACFGTSQAKTLTEIAIPTSTAGVYTVQGSVLSLSGGGSAGPLGVTYAAVSDDIVLATVQHYDSSFQTLAAAGDSSNPVVQYGAPASNARNMTLLKQ